MRAKALQTKIRQEMLGTAKISDIQKLLCDSRGCLAARDFHEKIFQRNCRQHSSEFVFASQRLCVSEFFIFRQYLIVQLEPQFLIFF